MNLFRAAFLLASLSLPVAVRGQVPPGYDGTFPAEAAQQALREAMKAPWEDTKQVAGGGTWRLVDGKVTPHALGPCRGDVMEMRSAETKGPHLRLVRDHLAICFPTTTDGDVAATLRWLGRDVPAGVAGEPTENWTRAAARVAALGPETRGLRLALLEVPGRPRVLELIVWRVAADSEKLQGTATLEGSGAALPLPLLWPAKAKPDGGNSLVDLKPGSTLVQPIDLDALLRANGRDPVGGPDSKLRVRFTMLAPDGSQVVATSPVVSVHATERMPVPKAKG